MAHNPIFPLYYNDFDRSTKDWTDEEVGFFIRLLMHQWAQNSLPVEPERLQRIVTSLSKNNHILREKFVEKNGKFLNKRLEEIRAEMQAFSDKQRANGIKGGRPKLIKENPNETQTITQTKPKINPKYNPNDNPNKSLHIEDEDEIEVEIEIEKENEKNIKNYSEITERNLNAFAGDSDEKTLITWLSANEQKESNSTPQNGLKNDFEFEGVITPEKTAEHQKNIDETIFEDKGKHLVWKNEKNGFLKNEGFKYKICQSKNLEKLVLENLMTEFVANIELKQDYKSRKDLQVHFTNFLNKKTTHNGTTQFSAKPKFADILKNAGTRFGELGNLTGKDLNDFFEQRK